MIILVINLKYKILKKRTYQGNVDAAFFLFQSSCTMISSQTCSFRKSWGLMAPLGATSSTSGDPWMAMEI